MTPQKVGYAAKRFFMFGNRLSNTKNICKKNNVKQLNVSQEIEKNQKRNDTQKWSKDNSK